jgi:hypothetical protein
MRRTSGISYLNDFTIAYCYEFDEKSQQGGPVWNCVEHGVVNPLIAPLESGGEGSEHPYGNSGFNAYTWSGDPKGDPGYLESKWGDTRKAELLASLKELNTRNFFFLGHGSCISIGDNIAPDIGGFNMEVSELEDALGNKDYSNAGGWPRNHAYRFVFFNSCLTAKQPFWARAFGIYDHITTDEADAKPDRVQAFLGFPTTVRRPWCGVEDYDWYNVMAMFQGFFQLWMQGDGVYSLQECVAYAKRPHQSWPLGYAGMNLKTATYNPLTPTKIYGYPGITRTGHKGLLP